MEMVKEVLSPIHKSGKADPQILLRTLCSDFAQTFIIIDALDEYPGARNVLLTQLKALGLPSLHVFVTSRTGLRDTAESEEALILDVMINNEVIQAYVAGTLRRIAEREEVVASSVLPRFLEDKSCRIAVTDKVVTAARNNFLSAELQIRALQHADDDNDLQRILSTLKGTVEELVKDAMDRVRLQRDKDRALEGMRALMWTIYSNESLTILELQHALVLTTYPGRSWSKHAEQMKRFQRWRLVESTGYLLDFDNKAKSIQVHKAIRDYCDDPDVRNAYFSEALFQITESCLQCLEPTYVDLIPLALRNC